MDQTNRLSTKELNQLLDELRGAHAQSARKGIEEGSRSQGAEGRSEGCVCIRHSSENGVDASASKGSS